MRFFFEPRSVVLIGVSRQSGPGAYNNLEMMLRYGYKGRVYVVNPKVPEILGHKTYSKMEDLPAPLAPMMDTSSPFSSAKLTPVTARMSP